MLRWVLQRGVTALSGGCVMVWGSISLAGKDFYHWGKRQCRAEPRSDSATSSTPVPPPYRGKLYLPGWQHLLRASLSETSWNWQCSWLQGPSSNPDTHSTLVGLACDAVHGQHNHNGRLATNAAVALPSCLTSLVAYMRRRCHAVVAVSGSSTHF